MAADLNISHHGNRWKLRSPGPTFLVVDPTGQVLANHGITPGDLPAELPRVVDEGYPLFSPDSVASFSMSYWIDSRRRPPG